MAYTISFHKVLEAFLNGQFLAIGLILAVENKGVGARDSYAEGPFLQIRLNAYFLLMHQPSLRIIYLYTKTFINWEFMKFEVGLWFSKNAKTAGVALFFLPTVSRDVACCLPHLLLLPCPKLSLSPQAFRSYRPHVGARILSVAEH